MRHFWKRTPPPPVIWVADLRFSATLVDQVYHLRTSGRYSPREGFPAPAGESREGAALFGGGLGEPPNPYTLRFPPGKRADVRSADGGYEATFAVRLSNYGPTRRFLGEALGGVGERLKYHEICVMYYVVHYAVGYR